MGRVDAGDQAVRPVAADAPLSSRGPKGKGKLTDPDQVVHEMEEQLAQRDRFVRYLQGQLDQRDQAIQGLNAQLRQAHNAITWRATEPIRQFYLRVQRLQRRLSSSEPAAVPWAAPGVSSVQAEPAQPEGDVRSPAAESVTPPEAEPANVDGQETHPDPTAQGFPWNLDLLSAVAALPTSDVVDIVICAGPNTRAAERCVESIVRHTAPGSYQIHVIAHERDLPSGPLRSGTGVDIIRHAMEVFNFARANNLGIARSAGDVVLLNDDTEVTPGWLEQLKRDSRGVALTGAHTGFQSSGNPDMWGAGEARITWYPINMFCAYIPRRVLEVVGPLDEEFSYYGGEDVDYSCRALQHGFPLVISSAFVSHESNRSYGAKTTRLMAESDKIIYERYGVVAPFDLQAIKPIVSVIMAARNRERLLPTAARSILDGWYTEIELIIVDDNSDDGTWSVIEQLQKSDARVIGIRMPKQVGSVKARSRGLNSSRGQFIAFMDDDDRAKPNRIWAPLEHLLVHPELGVVYCAFDVLTDSGQMPGRVRPFDAEDYLRMQFDIHLGTLLMRRGVIREVPLMSSYERAVDYDWVFRVLRRGYKISYCPAVVLDYNRIGVSASHLAGNPESLRQHRSVQNREKRVRELRRK